MYIQKPNIYIKVYADDIKVYAKTKTIEQCKYLQDFLDEFVQWVKALDLSLSVHKCAVMHYGHGNKQFVYSLDGTALPSTKAMKDLGVIVSNTLKYSDHVSSVVASASRRANWILRSFILPSPQMYLKLFNIYVLPIITYASSVWKPSLQKDTKIISAMQRRFIRRVAFKCGVPKDSIEYENILEILNENDQKQLNALRKHGTTFHKLFNITTTNTRRGEIISPKSIPNKKAVSNIFAWRVVRNP